MAERAGEGGWQSTAARHAAQGHFDAAVLQAAATSASRLTDTAHELHAKGRCPYQPVGRVSTLSTHLQEDSGHPERQRGVVRGRGRWPGHRVEE